MYLVVAFFLLLFRFGRDHWFAGDDWGLLVERDLSDPVGWMRPQNRHWLFVPTLVYQLLFETVGLRSYTAYQAVVVVLHLSLATLCRLTMRRAGVGPWTATLVAGTFVLLGAAYQAMLLVIMIGPLLSLVGGFSQLLLADHDGPIDRRDWLGLGAGLVGISSSGLGPVFVVVVSLATLLRRGWRAAAFHGGPLAVVWGVWYLVWGEDEGGYAATFDFETARQWVFDGWSGVFTAVGGYGPVAVALGVLLAAGLPLAWLSMDLGTVRRKAAAPAALLVGGVLVFAIASWQRSLIAQPDSSRYLGWAATMILPALAVAAYAFVARWRWTAPAIAVLFLVGVPKSIADLDDGAEGRREFTIRGRNLLLAAAQSPLLDQVPPDVFPDPYQSRGAEVTTGFLREVRDEGKLPSAELEPRIIGSTETRLRLSQSAVTEPMPPELECARYDRSIVVDARRGDRFGLTTTIEVVPLRNGEPVNREATAYSTVWNGRILTVQVPELQFEVRGSRGEPYEFCRAPDRS